MKIFIKNIEQIIKMKNEIPNYHHKTRSMNSVQSELALESPNRNHIKMNGSFNDSNNGSPKYK